MVKWNMEWNGGMEYGKMEYGMEQNMEWNGGMEYGMDGEWTVNHVTDALLSLGWAIPTIAWALTSLQRLYEQFVADISFITASSSMYA